MKNLLTETLTILTLNKKTIHDVCWVGSFTGAYVIMWEDFEKIANINYSESYGRVEIVDDLVVVGKTFWLSREEYDGSEWWKYNELPHPAKNFEPFDVLNTNKYRSSIYGIMNHRKNR